MRCCNCDAEVNGVGQRFCGNCGAPLVIGDEKECGTRKRIVDEAWEAGKEQGRKEERERSVRETKTFLWATIVLGAIGGGAVAAESADGDSKPLAIVGGVLLGGLLGGLYFFFGGLLTIVIFILGMVAIAACVAT